MEARRIPIYQSLHRHNLVLGAERELTMLAAMIALMVGIGGLTLLSASVAALFWFVAIFVLRRMAKADPLMSRVWRRHIRQQSLYEAKASRWRIAAGGYQARS